MIQNGWVNLCEQIIASVMESCKATKANLSQTTGAAVGRKHISLLETTQTSERRAGDVIPL